MALSLLRQTADQSDDSFYLSGDLRNQLLNSNTPIRVFLNRSSNQNQNYANYNYNQPIINLQIVIPNNGSNNRSENSGIRPNWAKILTASQTALDQYQEERAKYERQIYDVFAAIVPQSKGGQPKWRRVEMENERDAQENVVNRLKQEYENKLQKLDELIECCEIENKDEILNRLIQKKLSLLNQEVSNRKRRDKELDSEISRALKPVKNGGFYSQHRMELQNLQRLVRQDISRLQRLINETNSY